MTTKLKNRVKGETPHAANHTKVSTTHAVSRVDAKSLYAEPDYTERAALSDRKAQAARFKQAKQLWRTVQHGKDSMCAAAVAIVNTASQLGGVLLQISGGDQLGFSFWNAECEKQLPFNLTVAQELISVHKKIPEPITEFSQIWPVWKQVNLALGTLQIPERAGEQMASNISPLTALSHSLNHSFMLFEKWTLAKPLTDWDASTLETIVVETKQIHDLHETAAEVLKGKTESRN